ncbi:phosphate propanoyltransferase [Anaeromusa sp.]|uniref:phosphate propanoyltransferase n=1 Tax=Anaeromusa sp. TaxID=1872520 RepID=UPI0026323C82|nr:phosphate propanoyltransferase [Anaeromusa sp.]MDD3156934.1 phosphate propanoyltransferase [Anaeromusa sp.]
MSNKTVTAGISARHVHVTREHLDILYGAGYELTNKKDLAQPGQFASNETIDVVTEKSAFKNVRILGPIRSKSQVEVSMSDAMKLGLKNIPVRDSGDLVGTPGAKLVGPKGEVQLTEGVIVAGRHIHMNPAEAAEFGVKDKDLVKVRCGGNRGLIFENVLIRVNKDYALEMHVDTDEGNAALCKNGDQLEVIVD